MELEQLLVSAPAAGEVLVRVAGVGICHTDLVARDQIIPVPLPVVLGHEASGIVEAVGAGVHDIEPGDAVVLSFASCGHCRHCDDDKPGYCEEFPQRNFLGRRLDGSTAYSGADGPIGSHFFGQSSFAELAVTDRKNLVRVDSPLPIELLGPLGCGIQTGAGAVLLSLDCQPGSSIAIFGAGAVGLSAVLAAATRRCATIIVVEPVAARRELAMELGATHVFDPSGGEDVTAMIRAVVPKGVDASLDVSGVPAAIEQAIAVVAKRGTCGLVGAPQKPGQTAALRFGQFVQNGTRLVGIMEGYAAPSHFIPSLLALQAEGRFPFEKMLTVYPFGDIEKALSDQASGLCVKPVLVMNAKVRPAAG